MNSCIKFLKNKVFRNSFRMKLLISYIFFIILIPTIFILYGNNVLKNNMSEYVLYSAENNFQQTSEFLNAKIENINDTADLLIASEDVQSIMFGNVNFLGIYDYAQTFKNINFFISNIMVKENVNNVKIYVNEEFQYSKVENRFLSKYIIENSNFYKDFNYTTNVLVDDLSFTGINKNNCSLIKRSYSIKDFSKIVGYIQVEFNKSLLMDILTYSSTIPESNTYIADVHGNVIIQNNPNGVLLLDFTPINKTENFSEYILNGSKVYYDSAQINNTNWYLITVIDSEKMLENFNHLWRELFLGMAFIGLVALIIAFLISNYNSARLVALKVNVSKVEKGELIPVDDLGKNDEIGELTRSYNYMISQTSRLLEEKYLDGIALNNAKLKLLEAQINPHFLYNTLDMINWLAVKNDAEAVNLAVTSLADFYRTSLSNGKSEITLSEELLHVQSFINIQNIRFNNGIELVIDISDELLQNYVPKLILQPLIENSILHGILKKPSKKGNIIIEAVETGNGLYITVHDDGIGVSPETLDNMNNYKNDEDNEIMGFAIHNLRQRIKLEYGAVSNILFDTNTENGVSAIVYIARCKVDFENEE